MKQNVKKDTIWTANFTIITIGSLLSMCGNSISGFAMGLLVLDYTKSTLYYSIYLLMYTLPRLIVPLLVGAYVDRCSKRKLIYTLDFLSVLVYIVLAIVMGNQSFHFRILLLSSIVLGSIDSIYKVTYDSFYPLLVKKENYQKAYSVSTMLDTIATLMIPVSAVLYNAIGIVPLFAINAVLFLLAAVSETRIKVKEDSAELQKKTDGGSYVQDLKAGLQYFKIEKGLLAIVIYFFFSSISNGASEVIELPFFKANYDQGEFTYMYVWAGGVIGRVLGGMMQYHLKVPSSQKFRISVTVYLLISVLGATYLFTPINVMIGMCFVIGFGSSLSYNIRNSATQSYVPKAMKGRYNGTFRFIETSGLLLGQLFSGIMTAVVPGRSVLVIFMVVTLIAGVWIMGSYRERVAPIYNIE